MTLPLASRISKEQFQTDHLLLILSTAWSKINFLLLFLLFHNLCTAQQSINEKNYKVGTQQMFSEY